MVGTAAVEVSSVAAEETSGAAGTRVAVPATVTEPGGTHAVRRAVTRAARARAVARAVTLAAPTTVAAEVAAMIHAKLHANVELVFLLLQSTFCRRCR